MEGRCEDVGKGPGTAQVTHFVTVENLGLTEPLSWEDPEAFLVSFEKVAEACRWPREEWASRLVPALSGEAERAFRQLTAGDREDYGKVKATILQGDAIKREVRRQCFRQFRFQEVEDPQRAYSWLRELCRQWLKPEKHTKEQILDLVVLEQFLAILPQEVRKRVEKCGPKACIQNMALVEDLLKNHPEAKTWRLEEPLQKIAQSFLRTEDMTKREICQEEAKQQGDGDMAFLSRRAASQSVSDGRELAESALDEGTVNLKGATVLTDAAEKTVLNPIQRPMYWEVSEEENENETIDHSGGRRVLRSLEGREKIAFVLNSEHKETFPGRSTKGKETESSQQGSPERQGPPAMGAGEAQESVSLSPGVMWRRMSDRGTEPGELTPQGTSKERAEGIAEPAQEKKHRHSKHGYRTGSSTLARHRQIHTRERPDQCLECGKTFCGVRALYGHLRIHRTQTGPRDKLPLTKASLTKGNEGLSKFREETPQQRRNEREDVSNGGKAEFPQSKMALAHESEGEPEWQQRRKTLKTQNEPIWRLEGCTSTKETTVHMWVKKLLYSSPPGDVCPSTSKVLIQETPPTEKAPYKYPLCGKTFTNQVRLEDHQRLHTGDALWMPTVWGKVSLEKLSIQTPKDP